MCSPRSRNIHRNRPPLYWRTLPRRGSPGGMFRTKTVPSCCAGPPRCCARNSPHWPRSWPWKWANQCARGEAKQPNAPWSATTTRTTAKPCSHLKPLGEPVARPMSGLSPSAPCLRSCRGTSHSGRSSASPPRRSWRATPWFSNTHPTSRSAPWPSRKYSRKRASRRTSSAPCSSAPDRSSPCWTTPRCLRSA